MTDRGLMQQALDALEKLNKDGWILADFEDEVYAAIKALRARLAQPEQEPVAWRNTETGEFCTGGFLRNQIERWQPLYTAPPRKEWQGLTENDFGIWREPVIGILRWAEAVLKEKNT